MEGMTLPQDATTGPNCGLTAIAVAAGCSLAEATAAYERRVGKRHGSWRGRTHWTHTLPVIRRLGVSFTKVELPRRMTLATFVRDYTARGVRYVVRTTGHVQVIKDGWLVDQNGRKPVDGWQSRKRVLNAIALTN